MNNVRCQRDILRHPMDMAGPGCVATARLAGAQPKLLHCRCQQTKGMGVLGFSPTAECAGPPIQLLLGRWTETKDMGDSEI